MNDNTILRIKVPAHLYESVKEQLTLKEAKGKAHYGAGMEVVKEKKMKTPKDGMHKMEEEKVEENVTEAVDPNLIGGILGILLGGGPIVATILKQYKDAKTPEEKAEVLKQASQTIGGKMSGKMEEAKDEEKKEEVNELFGLGGNKIKPNTRVKTKDGEEWLIDKFLKKGDYGDIYLVKEPTGSGRTKEMGSGQFTVVK
jgi:hypothetical protein